MRSLVHNFPLDDSIWNLRRLSGLARNMCNMVVVVDCAAVAFGGRRRRLLADKGSGFLSGWLFAHETLLAFDRMAEEASWEGTNISRVINVVLAGTNVEVG